MTTSRREFLAGLAAAGVVLPGLSGVRLLPRAQAAGLALPSPAQLAWQDLELGMFIHFGPNTWQEQEYDDRTTPLDAVDPDIDTDQWVETAVGMGARYIVMVAKHVGGFCWWQTQTTEYSVRNTPWKSGRGDVMTDLALSCAARNMQLGVYLSPRDDSVGAGGSGRCSTPEAQARYDALYRQQLTELLTRYGPIMELWLDGSSVVPTIDIVRRYAPDAMIFQGPNATIRWVGNEDGFAPYPCWNSLAAIDADTGVATAMHGDPAGDRWMPVEVDVSLRRPNWFWSTTNHANLLSLEQLVEIYYRSVGRGTQLLLNVTPDRTGHVPQADVDRLTEFGTEIRRRLARSLAETNGAGTDLHLDLGRSVRVNHVVIEEYLRDGERIRGWRLEGLTDGAWRTLAEGSAIGRKRIQPIDAAVLSSVRLRVTRSVGEPSIRRLAAYGVGSPPPATWSEPVHLWADDVAGRWTDGNVEIDLASRIDGPGRYRVRLAAQSGTPVALHDAGMEIDGERTNLILRPADGRSDLFYLDLRQDVQA
ncbi:MAG: alpha-L-fucosidase, partial [Gemmatimonadales bacterium]|nr:alpha-L-fucosidase [Gemmatimonadales bacterium]